MSATREQVLAAYRNTPGAIASPSEEAINYWMGVGLDGFAQAVANARKENPLLAQAADMGVTEGQITSFLGNRERYFGDGPVGDYMDYNTGLRVTDGQLSSGAVPTGGTKVEANPAGYDALGIPLQDRPSLITEESVQALMQARYEGKLLNDLPPDLRKVYDELDAQDRATAHLRDGGQTIAEFFSPGDPNATGSSRFAKLVRAGLIGTVGAVTGGALLGPLLAGGAATVGSTAVGAGIGSAAASKAQGNSNRDALLSGLFAGGGSYLGGAIADGVSVTDDFGLSSVAEQQANQGIIGQIVDDGSRVVIEGSREALKGLTAAELIGSTVAVGALNMLRNGGSVEQAKQELINQGADPAAAEQAVKNLQSQAGQGTAPGAAAAGTITGNKFLDQFLGNAALSNIGGGSGSGGGTTDPVYRNMILANYAQANQVADNLAPRRISDFAPIQLKAMDQIANANNAPGMQAAQRGLSRLENFQAQAPQINAERAGLSFLGNAQQTGFNAQTPTINAQAAQVGNLGDAAMMNAAQINRGDIRNINAGSFLQGDINAYLNPYTSAVIDRAAQDNERARLLAQQQINAQAVGRGAFGGSRQAIAESENTRNFLDTQARTASQLRAQGFDTAANLMQNDLNRSMQGQAQNQAADQSVAFQNAGFNQQANASNQAAQNQFALSRYGTETQNSQFNAGQANQVAAQNAGNFLNAQGQNLSARQFDVGQQNQFDLTRFGAQNQMNQFNASQGNAVAATNAANNLQAQGMNLNALGGFLNGGFAMNNAYMGNAQAMFGAGAQQQALAQSRFDAERNNPLEQQQIRNAALGMANQGQNAFQQQAQPNQFGQFLGGALGINALYNAGRQNNWWGFGG